MPIINHAGEEFHLSHEEEEKLNNFQGITNFPEDDLPLVIKLLQNHGWNLEAALSRYFDDEWKESVKLINSGAHSSAEFATGRVPENIAIPMRNDTPIDIPNVETPSFFHDEIMRNEASPGPFLGSHYVPSLPLIRKLPTNYRDNLKVVGLTTGVNVWDIYNLTASGTTNELLGPLIVILLLVPKIVLRAGLSLFSLLWGIIAFGFTNNLNNDSKSKVYHIPNAPLKKYFENPEQKTEQSYAEIVKGYMATHIDDDNKISMIESLLPNENKNFNDLLEEAQSEFKYLLVLLLGNLDSYSPSQLEGKKLSKDVTDIDINSHRFLNRVLIDDAVLKTLADYKDELLVYVGSVSDVEPWFISQELKLKYTPDSFLVANVLNSNGSVNGSTRLSILSKIRMTSAKRFSSSLKNTIERYRPELLVSRTDVQELRLAREIKQKQEEAYQNSLMQDRNKEEKRLQEEKERKELETMLAKKQREQALLTALHELRWLSKCIEKTTHLQQQNSISNGGNKNIATLQIRTADGKRIIKKIAGDMTLRSLYEEIGCHLYLELQDEDQRKWLQQIQSKLCDIRDNSDSSSILISLTETDENSIEKLKDIVHNEMHSIFDELPPNLRGVEDLEIKFELISPFPRTNIPMDENKVISDIKDIWPKGNLLVEHIDEDLSTSESDDETN